MPERVPGVCAACLPGERVFQIVAAVQVPSNTAGRLEATAARAGHGSDQRWAMDFMHDELLNGRRLRVLTVIDVFTRECLALEARRRFRGMDVATILGELVKRHGTPETIQCDQGTEFTSMAMDHWAYWNKVGLDFSRPGTPGDNARNEAFNGTVRRECLSQYYLWDISEATIVLDSWRNEYNNERPHGSLGHIPPAWYKAGWGTKDDPAQARKCR